MTIRVNGGLGRCLAGYVLGALIGFAFVPAAAAEWLSPWLAPSPAEIERRLEAQGYVLTAPLVRRPWVYLADVNMGSAGHQHLIIDARSGQILERFVVPGRMWGHALAAGGEAFGEPPPGVGGLLPTEEFSGAPESTAAGRSAHNAPTNVHIPAAISPYGAEEATAGTKPKAKSVSTERHAPANRAVALITNPPLPPPAPREAAKPDGWGSSTSKPAEKHELEPKVDFRPTEVNDAPSTAPPAASGSSAPASDKPKVSVVPPALFE